MKALRPVSALICLIVLAVFSSGSSCVGGSEPKKNTPPKSSKSTEEKWVTQLKADLLNLGPFRFYGGSNVAKDSDLYSLKILFAELAQEQTLNEVLKEHVREKLSQYRENFADLVPVRDEHFKLIKRAYAVTAVLPAYSAIQALKKTNQPIDLGLDKNLQDFKSLVLQGRVFDQRKRAALDGEEGLPPRVVKLVDEGKVELLPETESGALSVAHPIAIKTLELIGTALAKSSPELRKQLVEYADEIRALNPAAAKEAGTPVEDPGAPWEKLQETYQVIDSVLGGLEELDDLRVVAKTASAGSDAEIGVRIQAKVKELEPGFRALPTLREQEDGLFKQVIKLTESQFLILEKILIRE
ncbi:MAG: hypothetical protein AB1540_06370 [Bdellovibrionota bacterium]